MNLGAGNRRIEGYTSVDICRDAEFVADLRERWPWEDSTVEEVLAYDVFEHLPDKTHTMNELWRVLKPGGRAKLQIPHATQGDGGHCDPTHRSYWTQTDFEYYEPGYAERERFRDWDSYPLKADFTIANLDARGHIPMTRHERRRGGYVMEMQVLLEAVKK